MNNSFEAKNGLRVMLIKMANIVRGELQEQIKGMDSPLDQISFLATTARCNDSHWSGGTDNESNIVELIARREAIKLIEEITRAEAQLRRRA